MQMLKLTVSDCRLRQSTTLEAGSKWRSRHQGREMLAKVKVIWIVMRAIILSLRARAIGHGVQFWL